MRTVFGFLTHTLSLSLSLSLFPRTAVDFGGPSPHRRMVPSSVGSVRPLAIDSIDDDDDDDDGRRRRRRRKKLGTGTRETR